MQDESGNPVLNGDGSLFVAQAGQARIHNRKDADNNLIRARETVLYNFPENNDGATTIQPHQVIGSDVERIRLDELSGTVFTLPLSESTRDEGIAGDVVVESIIVVSDRGLFELPNNYYGITESDDQHIGAIDL